ncbi:hypothetical protein HPC49_16540 [Pyxidicoccus fallax]|uniref:Uncharacterized protein n=1 Tax=Pyxidicoccus fallax TaxID=394095 RepID=A0A848LNY8_9BACT|nr:hypothetical protein [Pyxidicoccus fallax]NMO19254.1 hypothetical protein [Pyxidicoccus fallax]NPC79825.1 hypothetical protein [Pyxidicoccus fallax]
MQTIITMENKIIPFLWIFIIIWISLHDAPPGTIATSSGGASSHRVQHVGEEKGYTDYPMLR